MYLLTNEGECNRIASFIPIIIVYCLIGFIYYTYMTYYIFEVGIVNLKIFSFLISIFFLLLILINYWLCFNTDPGTVKLLRVDFEKENLGYNTINVLNNNNIITRQYIESPYSSVGEKELYCEKCSINRPERAHHCKVCKKCIIKMDHHCPWIANCVGHNNQKYFYLFLFYCVTGCVFILFGLLQKFSKLEDIMDNLYKNQHVDSNTNLNYYDNTSVTYVSYIRYESDIQSNSTNYTNSTNISNIDHLEPMFIVLSSIICIILLIATGSLFIIHTYLLLNNITTIEYRKYQPKEKSPYHSKEYLNNFKAIMGNNLLSWFFPM